MHSFFCQGLTNLIILSLDGNPLVEQLESYRTYVVFHLPTLKALDGIAVVCTCKGNQSKLFKHCCGEYKICGFVYAVTFFRRQLSVKVQKICLRED